MACALQANLVDCKRAAVIEPEMQERRSLAIVLLQQHSAEP